jgi:formylglycine-generating enzyme required for sulfatase activity
VYEFTAPVGRFRANAFGLYDMHGNVFEWCWDGYKDDYYRKSPAVDPQCPSGDARRVIRGGSWISSPRYARSATRYRLAPDIRYNSLGFRVARGRSGAR